MGLFDTVHCMAKVPGAEMLGNQTFRTSDLGRRMDKFTIADDGRLIHHRTYRAFAQPVRQQVPELDVVVPLHRDVSLFGEDSDGNLGCFVARFTEEYLEWIRPREELSEVHREYLTAGDI